jgi:outer membrane protein assembly factor BamB
VIGRGLTPIVILVGLTAGSWTKAAAQISTRDYPQWRGQARDGAAAAFAEPQSWPDKLTLKWKVDVGPGYATPIVVGNRVYTHTRRDDNEVMTALDADSGKVVWQTSYPAPYKMNPATSRHGQGPKATPLYDNGKLYTLGISGIVSAFDAASGKLLWQKAAPPVDPLYGTAMSPIADNGVVIVHIGGHNQGALTAFEADTGNVKWSWNGDGPAYASPVIADLGGTRQVISITQQNIVGVAVATGELLWQRPFVSRATNNAITPIIDGDTIIVSGQDKGVTAFKAMKRNDRWGTDVIWETQEVSLFMSSAVLVGDTIFGLSHRNSGQFFALDAKSGKVLWLGQPRQATNTAIVKAGKLLFLLDDDAELIVARSSRSGFEPLRRYTVAESATWAQPAITGDRLFIKDVSTLALWTLN